MARITPNPWRPRQAPYLAAHATRALQAHARAYVREPVPSRAQAPGRPPTPLRRLGRVVGLALVLAVFYALYHLRALTRRLSPPERTPQRPTLD